MQQGRHLGPGQAAIGTEPKRCARTAPAHSRVVQPVYRIGAEHAGSVNEARRPAVREVECPVDECSHLGPGHRVGGTETGRLRIAALSDIQLGEALHMALPPRPALDVGEARLPQRGLPAVEHTHHPHRELPALYRHLRTETASLAVRPRQDPIDCERRYLERREMVVADVHIAVGHLSVRRLR